MNIIDKNGNILDSTAPLICHQVNCKGAMGAGLAKQIRTRFPSVYKTYRTAFEQDRLKLGTVIFANILENDKNQIIANLCGQDNYGRSIIYTDYDAVTTCLKTVKAYATACNINRIAIPYGMSCGLAGGKWEKILDIINNVFKDTDLNIEIYSFKGE